MSHVDLQKLALRLKIIEMLKAYMHRRRMVDAPTRWRRLISPN